MHSTPSPEPGPALRPGDPAPWFAQRSTSRDDYHFDTAAGRWIVLGFFATAGDAAGRAALAAVAACRDRFDDRFASFFGVSLDPADRACGRVAASLPGIRFFWDFDAEVSAACGVVPAAGAPHGPAAARRQWLVLVPMLRVHRVLPMAGPDAGGAALAALLARLPPPECFAGTEVPAPVLVLPQVLEPDLCARLVACYDAAGGKDSGFMREQAGLTVMVSDHQHKRRSDLLLQDPAVVIELRDLLFRRVVPEIRKVFQFEATRMERFLIGC